MLGSGHLIWIGYLMILPSQNLLDNCIYTFYDLLKLLCHPDVPGLMTQAYFAAFLKDSEVLSSFNLPLSLLHIVRILFRRHILAVNNVS